MQAGRLDRRIRIEQAGESRDAQTRAVVRTWPPTGGALVAQPWAERLPATGREFYQAQQRIAEIGAGWRIRWSRWVSDHVTPTEGFRVVDDSGRAFDIVDVREEGRREGLLVFGKARAE
jgi:SPP1 family predicted phage head-tail adaptor